VIPLDLQLLIFAVMTLTGIFIGVWYDFNRAARESLRWRGPLGDLLDVVLWAGAAFLVLSALLLSNWGEFRFYVLVGLGLGVWVYRAWAGPVVLPWWRSFFQLLRRAAGALGRLSAPIRGMRDRLPRLPGLPRLPRLPRLPALPPLFRALKPKK